jgi:hypothetical protein
MSTRTPWKANVWCPQLEQISISYWW